MKYKKIATQAGDGFYCIKQPSPQEMQRLFDNYPNVMILQFPAGYVLRKDFTEAQHVNPVP